MQIPNGVETIAKQAIATFISMMDIGQVLPCTAVPYAPKKAIVISVDHTLKSVMLLSLAQQHPAILLRYQAVTLFLIAVSPLAMNLGWLEQAKPETITKPIRKP